MIDPVFYSLRDALSSEESLALNGTVLDLDLEEERHLNQFIEYNRLIII